MKRFFRHHRIREDSCFARKVGIIAWKTPEILSCSYERKGHSREDANSVRSSNHCTTGVTGVRTLNWHPPRHHGCDTCNRLRITLNPTQTLLHIGPGQKAAQQWGTRPLPTEHSLLTLITHSASIHLAMFVARNHFFPISTTVHPVPTLSGAAALFACFVKAAGKDYYLSACVAKATTLSTQITQFHQCSFGNGLFGGKQQICISPLVSVFSFREQDDSTVSLIDYKFDTFHPTCVANYICCNLISESFAHWGCARWNREHPSTFCNDTSISCLSQNLQRCWWQFSIIRAALANTWTSFQCHSFHAKLALSAPDNQCLNFRTCVQ